MKTSSFSIKLVALIMAYYPFSILYLAKIQLLFLGLTFACIIVQELGGKNSQIVKNLLQEKWLIILSAAFFVSAKDHSIIGLIPIFKPIIFVFVVISVLPKGLDLRIKTIHFLIKVTFIAFSVAVAVLMVFFGGLRAKDFQDMEVIGSFSNVAVAPSIVTLVFCFYFFKYTQSKMYLIGIVGSLMIIALTQSRAGYGMAMISILYGAIMISKSKRGTNYLRIFWIFFSLVAVGSVLTALSPSLLETVTKALDRFDIMGNIGAIFGDTTVVEIVDKTMREQQYDIARDLIVTNPLTGIGFNQFSGYFESLYGYPATVHNMFMKVWVAVGIGGFLVLLMMFYSLLVGLYKKYRLYSRMGVSYCSDFYLSLMLLIGLFIIQGQFRGMLGDYTFLLVIAIGMHGVMYHPTGEWSKQRKQRPKRENRSTSEQPSQIAR